MSPIQLSFREIHIRRMPGFEGGGFPVKDLVPGVNVVYGPNACGKTTVTCAIQRLLRPDAPTPESVVLHAVLEKDGQTLTIDYDYGQVRCQQGHTPLDTAPRLAPAGIEGNCVFALHDLIQSRDGSDLAKEIVDRTAGGYDIVKARDKLGFRPTHRTKGKLQRDLDSAKDTLRKALGKQGELAQKKEKLTELRRERDDAREAQQRVQLLRQWKEVLNAKEAVKSASTILESFPAEVGKLLGDEVEKLNLLRKELEKKRTEEKESATKRKNASRRLSESSLPAEGIASEVVNALRKQCNRLRELRNKLEEKQEARDAAEKRAEKAAKNLGAGVTVARAESLSSDITRSLLALARRAERVRAQDFLSETIAQWLGESKTSLDAAALGEGVQLLEQWLAANAQHSATRKTSAIPWIIAGAIVIVLALVLGLVAHLLSFLFLFVGIGLVAWPFVAPLLIPAPENPTAQIERKYAGLGIAAPIRWEELQVQTLVRQHRQSCAYAEVECEKATRWASLSAELRKSREALRELRQERDKWREKLGVEVNVDEAELALLASNFAELFQARQELAGATGKVERRESLLDLRTKRLQEMLIAFGFPPADDPETIESQIDELSTRREDHEDDRKEVSDCDDALGRVGEEIRKKEQGIADLFAQLGLASENEPKLREIVSLREDYLKAAAKLREAEGALRAAESACRADDAVKSVPHNCIDEEIQKCNDVASKYDDIHGEISGIETEIRLAKKASDAEQALANKQKLEDQLREQREEDCAAVVGYLLAEFIASEQREREQPRVLRRAQELFVRFTHGRYKLLVEYGNPPRFRAVDTARNIGQALDDLSSGTRLQLLLAAHVAFVEEQEGQYQLPLVFDETLGNSDERRAREIIDAAIEICKAGRQVFYLTAQYDEVGKWRSILRNHDDVPYREIDLAEVRNFSQEERILPIDFEPPEAVPVPVPNGADWVTYGRVLRVPPMQPAQPISGLHVWYVVHDPPLLHRLLKGGINLWGQLNTLREYYSLDGMALSKEEYDRAVAAADVLQKACEWFLVGRGSPVDRQVLLDSGAVSDKFIDELVALSQQVSGDALALLRALDDGKVKGFRRGKCEELREYLLQRGFLDEHERLSESIILDRVNAAAFRHVEEGLIDSARVAQLVRLVVRADTECTQS